MPCYSPILAWQVGSSAAGTPSRIFFRCIPNAKPIYIPCGKCIGCRLERSRQWAVRCVAEAQCHEKNCFVTLTYDDNHLPINGSLFPRDLTLFFKRMRKNLGQFRYFACGEYGDLNGRPHYHACIFGLDFRDDAKLVTVKDGNAASQFVESPTLAKLWTYGQTQVGTLTFESAAYVARYCLKKLLGATPAQKSEHYRGRKEEYVVMSRRPGIGSEWIEKHLEQTYSNDAVMSRGRLSKPPRYYDDQLKKLNPEWYELVKMAREKEEFEPVDEKELTRLKEVAQYRQQSIKRR